MNLRQFIQAFIISLLIFGNPVITQAQSYLFGSLTGPTNILSWTLVGDAFPGDTPGDANSLPDELLLTHNNSNSIGAVYYSTPINFQNCTGWRVEFEFRIHDGSGPWGINGDGIAFWVTPNPPSSFSAGTDLGIGPAMQGLKIGFDTFDAGCNGANPEIQIRNGVGYAECWAQPTLHNTANSLSFIRSNTYNTCVINYNSGLVTIQINGTTYLTGTSPISFASAYFGFSASTGAAWDLHSIRNVFIYTEQVPSNAGSDVAYCSGSTTTIGAAATAGYIYNWTPATGLSSATAANPTVSLTNNTTAPITQQYIVSTLTSASGSCPTYDTVVVTVNPLPQSNFTISTDTICEGAPITINSNNPAIANMAYNWNFDGATVNSGSGAGPYSITWNGQANHTISLTTTANGCTSSVSTDQIQVWQIPTPNFTISDSTLCQFDSAIVTYAGNATTNATYNWNFGNGTVTSGTGQGAYQIDYDIAGNTSVSLTVSENGCHSVQKTIPIVVTPRPVADFNLSAAQGCTDLTYNVQFTGSAAAGSTYNWDFNNATVVSGANAGPYVLGFPAQGQYIISLDVDLQGCTSFSHSDTIQIYTTPTSTFTVSDTGICEGEDVQLQYIGNASNGAAYNWGFDGASVNSGSGQGPYVIEWNTGGNPSITLVVTENGCVSQMFTQAIVVTAKPTANFTADLDLCEFESTVVTNTGNATSNATHNWSLNPATVNSGTGAGPYNILYTNAGSYVIEHSVNDNGCLSDTVRQVITVNPKPDASFTGVGLQGCEPITAVFSVTSQSNPTNTTYQWDFESSTGSGATPSVTFQAGLYDITLQAITPAGCRDTSTMFNYVNSYQMPNSYFSVNNTQLSGSSSNLVITDGSSHADSYYYSFGDGFISQDPNPSHNYSAEGEWTVTQVVSTNNGCVDSSSVTVFFAPSPMIFIPNSFTPGTDNINDTWKVSMSYISQFDLAVFNRWGEIIFRTNDIFNQWDGTSKTTNDKVPNGTYAFRIVYTDLSGITKDIVGSVNVIR